MFRLNKSVLSFGAGAFALGVLMLAVPGAAHAIGTLVQVTNTAANPAVTQDVAKLASQNVILVSSTGGVSPHGNTVLQQMFSNGTIESSPFVVPAGQNLVVTTVDLLPDYGFPAAGSDLVGIYNNVSGLLRAQFSVPNTTSTQQQFPNGFVFPAGESVLACDYGVSSSPVTFTVHGYLTSN